MYSDEINVDRLILQLQMLPGLFPGPGATNVSDLIALFKQKPQEIRQLFGDIERLTKLLFSLFLFPVQQLRDRLAVCID